ncbi:hypothetical protein RSAG8_03347, partial [Rhizoctonia solani AG-8 WAC10335]
MPAKYPTVCEGIHARRSQDPAPATAGNQPAGALDHGNIGIIQSSLPCVHSTLLTRMRVGKPVRER